MGKKERFMQERLDNLYDIIHDRPKIDEDSADRLYEAASKIRMVQKQMQLLLLDDETSYEDLRESIQDYSKALGFIAVDMLESIYLDPITEETADEEDIYEFLDDLSAMEAVRSFNERMDHESIRDIHWGID